MSKDFFSIPIYIDNTHSIEKIGGVSPVKVYVFLKKEDYTEENKSLLSKILQAIKLDMDKDVQLILLKNDQDAYIVDKIDMNLDNLFIAFGLNAKRLGLQCRTIPYTWMKFDTLKVLFSHTITDLQKNVAYKKQLWGLLQKLNS